MSDLGFQILVTSGARSDLQGCRAEDRYAAAIISTHLRELSQDAGRCECIIDEHHSDDVISDVEPVWDLQRLGINAYRLKYVLLGRWRVITGADRRLRRIAILAIMRRDANYQKDKALWERIKNEYEALDFPYLGR